MEVSIPSPSFIDAVITLVSKSNSTVVPYCTSINIYSNSKIIDEESIMNDGSGCHGHEARGRQGLVKGYP